MKNSFAKNNKGELFAWGNNEILGFNSKSNLTTPHKIVIKDDFGNAYKVDSISMGHFHVGLVANKITKEKNKNISYGKILFDKLKEFFLNTFMNVIINDGSEQEKIINFILLLLRMNTGNASKLKLIKFSDFEILFLNIRRKIF
jgi:hypothetical protein